MQHQEANQFIRSVADHLPGWSFRAHSLGDNEARGRLVRDDGMEIHCSFKGPKYEFGMSTTADVYRYADAPKNSWSPNHYADTRRYSVRGYEQMPKAGGTTSLGAKKAARRILSALVTDQAERLHTDNLARKRAHDQHTANQENLSQRLGLDGERGYQRIGDVRVEHYVGSDSVNLDLHNLTPEQAERVLSALRE